MMSPYYIITGACLLLVFLYWKEINRNNRSRLLWRLLASLVAVASLAGLVLPLNRQKKESPFHEIVLLTAGFNNDSVILFLQQAGKNIPLYSIEKKAPVTLNNQPVKQIADAGFFADQVQPALVHIFGTGLYKNELQSLAQIPVRFHPTKKKPSFSSVNWTQKINSGDAFSIQGTFTNPSPAPMKLFLKGLNTVVDSVSLAANTQQDFELRSIPKHTGNAVYSLIALSGKDTLEKEPVPFTVEQPGTLHILMLASSPGFENKFLKNWLSQQGHAVTVRTGISKNKYARQFLNTPKTGTDRISASYLEKFDLLITNTTELTLMTTTEIDIIRAAIAQKGMGLVVRADSGGNRSNFYLQNFPLFTPKHGQLQNLTLTPVNHSGHPFTLHVENPVCIRYQTGTQVLFQDEQANIFASSIRYGLGKIVVSSIAETYSLVLSGNNNDYTSLWSLLLQKAAKEADPVESWSVAPAFPITGERAKLKLETNSNGIPRLKAGEQQVFLQQNPLLPSHWEGSYWPDGAGWQSTIASLSQPAYWWYTYQPGDWEKLPAIQKIKDTREYEAAHPYSSADLQLHAEEMTRILYGCFFVAFLLSSGFLWIEQKM